MKPAIFAIKLFYHTFFDAAPVMFISLFLSLSHLEYSRARQKKIRLFSVLPNEVRNALVNAETFERSFDTRLQTVPDEPTINNYATCVAAESNSIMILVRYARSVSR